MRIRILLDQLLDGALCIQRGLQGAGGIFAGVGLARLGDALGDRPLELFASGYGLGGAEGDQGDLLLLLAFLGVALFGPLNHLGELLLRSSSQVAAHILGFGQLQPVSDLDQLRELFAEALCCLGGLVGMLFGRIEKLQRLFRIGTR